MQITDYNTFSFKRKSFKTPDTKEILNISLDAQL